MSDIEHKDHDLNLSFVAGLVLGFFLLFALGTKKGQKLIEQIKEEGVEIWEEFIDEHPQLAGHTLVSETKQNTGALETISRSAKRFFKKAAKKAPKNLKQLSHAHDYLNSRGICAESHLFAYANFTTQIR